MLTEGDCVRVLRKGCKISLNVFILWYYEGEIPLHTNTADSCKVFCRVFIVSVVDYLKLILSKDILSDSTTNCIMIITFLFCRCLKF